MSDKPVKKANDKSKSRVPMPEQAPEVRRRNFEEVPLGYTEEMAMEEAPAVCSARSRAVSTVAR